MRFKVGDKVRVREDLVVDEKYGDLHLTKCMERFKGQIVTIEEVREEDRTRYNLKEDDNKFWWSTEMLEPIEREKNNMNIEELNLEYKNKMDALMEEYKTKVKEITDEEEPFIEKGQEYFNINRYFEIEKFNYSDDGFDRGLLESGNMFPFTEETEDKVRKEVKLIAKRRRLQSEMEMFARQNNEEEIDWNDDNQLKWYLYINHSNNKIIVDYNYNFRELNTTYFTSKGIAQKALEKFDDRIRELYINNKESIGNE